MIELYGDSQIQARGSVASCAVGEGAALLDMRSSIYYTLNSVASCIWSNIQTPTTLTQLYAAIEAKFSTSACEMRADVQNLVRELIELDFIDLREASARQG